MTERRRKKPSAPKTRDSYDETLVLAQLRDYTGPGTISDLCRVLGITASTLNGWMKRHPAFLERVLEIRTDVDDKVEASLFDRAVGYSGPSREVKALDKETGDMVTVREEIEHVAPDVGAQKFWLANRRRKQWSRDGDEQPSDPAVDEALARIEKLLEGAVLDLPKDQYKEIAE